MSSAEGQFNVLLIVRDKVTKQRPQTTTFEQRVETKRNRIEVILLTNLTPYRWAKTAHRERNVVLSSVFYFFTSTETVGLLGKEAQDVHPDFHTAS